MAGKQIKGTLLVVHSQSVFRVDEKLTVQLKTLAGTLCEIIPEFNSHVWFIKTV